MNGIKPEWANLPRRKCDDCGKSYKPARPLREGQRGFCSDNCRKSYHKHGGAYRKLKVEILKFTAKELLTLEAGLTTRLRALIREELEAATVRITQQYQPDDRNPSFEGEIVPG